MFSGSRRHRQPVQPLTRETANPNAATAAASAFMRREPSTSLSSAAAAAALKARPMTPTNVAETPTKRTQRRSASVSSAGSRDRGRRDLQRTPSNGSMSERTFRSPSPGRSPAPKSHNVPPVPKLPNHAQFKTEKPNPTHRRAVSLQTQPFRTASQKMKDGQGSWFGAAAVSSDLSNVRRSDAVLQPRSVEDPRSGSTSPSINFSYPRSRFDSASDAGEQTMVYDANSRRMVPREDLLQREQDVRSASEKPVKKKKSGVSRSGSHLSKGTIARVKGTAVDSPPPVAATQLTKPSMKPVRAQEAKPTTQPEHHISREQTLVETDTNIEEPAKADLRKTDGATVLPPPESPRASVLGRKPSVVAEDPELESELDDEDSEEETISAVTPTPSQPNFPVSPVAETLTESKHLAVEKPEHVDIGYQNSSPRARGPSTSPARTTHFAPTTDKLTIRHEPPPRSLSPRKSALKQRSPTRSGSPSDDGSELSSVGWSGRSLEDPGISRRKSARVSFDDQNTVVVGESAEPQDSDSPILASPQTKKAWHNILGRHKKDPAPLEEDETMTPRPALPSFGSVREKKMKETEERPLVRPVDRTLPYQQTQSPPRQSSPMSGVDIGQSSDLAVGSILSQEQSSRNAANISKFREPLPPVVTSVGNGGNDSLSSEDEGEPEASVTQSQSTHSPSQLAEESATMATKSPNGSATASRDFAEAKQNAGEEVPTISIIHPTPGVQDESETTPDQEYFEVPGGFSAEGLDDMKPQAQLDAERRAMEGVPAQASVGAGSEQGALSTPRRSQEPLAVSTSSSPMQDIQEEVDETDGSSIYSDAYEDLSDIEGDGFISLDAVLNPPDAMTRKLYEKTMAESKEVDVPRDEVVKDIKAPESPKNPDDWETAKAYWKSLNPDKRRQLEKEAMEEAGEDADLDQSPQQKKKTKKRKSLDQPRPEPKVSDEVQESGRVYQIQPGTKWADDGGPKPETPTKATASGSTKLRKSMPNEQAVATSPTRMRKSMRGAGPATEATEGRFRKSMRAEPEPANGGMRKSLRANGDAPEPRTPPKKAPRPVSYQPTASAESATAHRRHQSADARPGPKPGLRRRGSDSSESSFQRMRPGGGEGFGFRKTLRGAAREPESGKGSSRFSLRSLSPTGSAFRRGMGANTMRPDSSDGSASRKRLSGFGRSPGKKAHRSRFADSSDEEDGHQPRFNSRFVDSSDDEDTTSPPQKQPKTLRASSSAAAATAMGVPAARVDHDDSSDLPDSDDEAAKTRRNTLQNGMPHRSGSGRGSIAPSPPQALGTQAVQPRPSHSRRGSFMSILRRRKDPADKISRASRESAARRDTRLERSNDELAVIQRNSSGSGTANANASARLQKRGARWPLADDEADDDGTANPTLDDRPSTSGGPNPAFLGRQSTAPSDAGHDPALDGSPDAHKKKKFGTLRKMFGLND